MTAPGDRPNYPFGDPLVPVSGDHVRAVLLAARLSEREAVQALEEQDVYTQQPTLDHIIRGRQRRCRKSLREGLARLLPAKLPPEWLDGEHDSAIWAKVHLDLLAEPDSATGKEIARIRSQKNVPHRPSIGPDLSGPPLYQLIAYQLATDLEAKGIPEESIAELIRVLSLSMWRRWFAPSATMEVIDLSEMDHFAEVMSEAVRIVLRPWLDGDSLIKDGRLGQVQRAVEAVGRQIAYARDLVRSVNAARERARGATP